MDTSQGVIPLWGLIVSGMAMSTITIMAIVGNILVIVSYFRDKRLQTVYNIYIVNLAIADLFIGGVSMLFYVPFTLTNKVWMLGRAFCKVWCVNDYSVCLQSVLLLVLLSLDRVVLLRTGAQYFVRETKRRAIVKCVISWIVALGVYGPAVVFWDVVRGHSDLDDDDCEAEFITSVNFGIVASVCELIIPSAALSVLNVMVFNSIRKRLNLFPDKSSIGVVPSKQSNHTVFSITPTTDEVLGDDRVVTCLTQNDNNTRKSRLSDRKDMKAAKHLAVLVVAFLVCWGPYTICTLVASLCEDCVNVHLYEFVTWLLWVKSAVNPLLYASQSTQFKVNFIKLLPFLKLCQKY